MLTRAAARCSSFKRSPRRQRRERLSLRRPDRRLRQCSGLSLGQTGVGHIRGHPRRARIQPVNVRLSELRDRGEAMTTLENRPNTALLVIDVQNGVVGGAYERDTIVANVGTVVEKARAAEVPIVWVQHSSDNLAQGSEQWKIVPELSPAESEALVQKRYPDSFEETTLESVLTDLAVGRLVVVGAQTDECVRSTLHGALVRGYDATLVSDAHTTEDLSPWGAPPPELVIAHTNLYWGNHEAPGRTAGTVEAKDVDFAGS
jgi:hypothetical protein